MEDVPVSQFLHSKSKLGFNTSVWSSTVLCLGCQAIQVFQLQDQRDSCLITGLGLPPLVDGHLPPLGAVRVVAMSAHLASFQRPFCMGGKEKVKTWGAPDLRSGASSLHIPRPKSVRVPGVLRLSGRWLHAVGFFVGP